MQRQALIVGAGGVLGAALEAEFRAAGYEVAGLRRSAAPDAGAAQDIIACDLTRAAAVELAVQAMLDRRGAIDVVVCNTAHRVVAPMARLRFEDFERSWAAAIAPTIGALRVVLPAMAARGRGAVLVSGATASRRGSPGFAAFASAKFALRGLTQSLAREYDPLGVHVAHVVIDGVLRGSAAAVEFSKAETGCIDPRDAAAVFRSLAEQPRSTWTHELDLRPCGERF